MEKRTRKRSKEARRARIFLILGVLCVIAGLGALFLDYTWVAVPFAMLAALLVGMTIGLKLPRTKE
ncbi:hypothetical protein BMT55_10615 [Listeria newyorkensis]|uniref:Uncharacterized protein n=1 Tax=Listeria newyorkensis TaxID=1497681 RepID=A0ABX4XKY6_9LIST|nr:MULTISPECIES: hypothetical protein [Listeria]KGL38639.1 hypothetical protein EP56_15855 [Listeriaceae bacterium FSL A5-0209]KGL46615.1 hypothetical protein EP58_00895 [Listeria newyorkensis]KMT59025.1 hypothetical protein X559_2813 [Listeria newyorkensis]PNP91043.1 hypothetical protein BMT55_10615 [Listeria newyorkensis]RQW67869.1 hypothetical protein DUK53_00365 [Listeria sp. SHR_NRA_18]